MTLIPVSTSLNAVVDVSSLTDRLDTLEAANVALTARVTALEPPPFVPVLGLAVNTITSTYPAAWAKDIGQFGPVAALRWYSASIPTAWPTPVPVNGPTVLLASFKSDPTQTAAGTYDAQITAFAKTVPAGAYLTWQHEADQKSKNITPTAFAAAWNRVYDLVKAQQPNCHMAPVMQTYTFNDRTDTRGTLPWITSCNPLKVDFVGLDAYSSSTVWRSLADEVGPAAAFLRNWAGTDLPVVLGEFNQAKSSGRAQWLTDAGAFILDSANRVALACLYDATYGIGYELVEQAEVDAFAAVAARARAL